MYFKTTSPEKAGVKSSHVKSFIKSLDDAGIAMHSVLISRGDKLFCEAYWAPNKADDNHRMYSATKSYVGVALLQLAEDGVINLDDKIIDFFPECLPEKVHPYLAAQTIRNMLNMKTCFAAYGGIPIPDMDRVKFYFSLKPVRYPGTTFYYDSTGSLVLAALIEKVTGKSFLEYLREKCLNEIGWSQKADVLTVVGGYAWGDSALLCSSREMLLFGRLLANKGEWNGKQLLSKNAVETATHTPIHFMNFGAHLKKQGYGGQIWGSIDGSFMFSGMHGQFTIYHPKTDLLFVCTAGHPMEDVGYSEIIFKAFFDEIVFKAEKGELPESDDYKALIDYTNGLELLTVKGDAKNALADKINGKCFKATENPMGITEFSLSFEGEIGKFNYINATGEKTIEFGFGKNIKQLFPEAGYPNKVCGIPEKNFKHTCYASGGWVESQALSILVQIIDDYIGILDITIGFNGDMAVIDMRKSAEGFLNEYHGYLTAR